MVVVAHSMGGLVARSAMVQWQYIGANVGKLTTLATPHHGTKKFIAGLANIPDAPCIYKTDSSGAKDLVWDKFDEPNA